MTRAEYAAGQGAVAGLEERAQAEAAMRLRAVTQAAVAEIAAALARGEQPVFDKAALAGEMEAIIRAAAQKPLERLRETQAALEATLAERLGIPIPPLPPPTQVRRNAAPPSGRQSFAPESRQGRAWAVSATPARGVSAYTRDPTTGKIVWDSRPLEMLFTKRHDLSTDVWRAVEQMEGQIFDVVRGGLALGRDAKDIGKDLETFVKYKDGGARVLGRWGAMFPNTEKGRRAAWEREYLQQHGGLQPRSDAAQTLLRTPEAKRWLEDQMLLKTKRGTPKLPAAVKVYAGRLGKAGLDYRVIRIMRTETAALVADEQARIARDSNVSSGEVRWVLHKGRERWACSCEAMASGGKNHDGVYTIDELDLTPPLHPNCTCELRPILLSDEELEKRFEALLAERDDTAEPAPQDADAGFVAGAGQGDTQAGFALPDNLIAKLKDYESPVFIPRESDAIIVNQLKIPQGRPATPLEAWENANPNFSRDNGYKNNCQRSVLAYVLQRRGFRVTALPAPGNRDKDPIKNGMECFVDAQGKHPISRASGGKDDLLTALNEEEDGALFLVMHKWNDSREEGHIYVAERIKDTVVFINPQNKGINAWTYFDKIEKTDGKYELYFERVDNADLNPNIDYRQAVSVYDEQVYTKRNERAIIVNRGREMNEQEAFEILKNSDYVKPRKKNGVVYYDKLGKLYREYERAFSFVGYPYSSEEAVDPTFAFEYFVYKDRSPVFRSDGPISPEELRRLVDVDVGELWVDAE